MWFCQIISDHYEDTPIQIYLKFYNQKDENFHIKNSDIFHIPAEHIDCGYSLEPPRSYSGLTEPFFVNTFPEQIEIIEMFSNLEYFRIAHAHKE